MKYMFLVSNNKDGLIMYFFINKNYLHEKY